MPSNREIANDWGCAPSYVDRCVKRGCPTDSFEAARFWLAANTKRSRISQRRLEKIIAEEKDDDSPAPWPSRNESFKDKSKGGQFANDESSENSLYGIKKAVKESSRLLNEALIEGKTQKIGAWISLHTKAVEAMVKTESMVREELERQKILIPLSEAQSMARKVVGVIVSRLNALPQNLSARCSLTDPQMTLTVLEDECAAILKDAQQAL
jgi:hypothetical protein